MNHPSRLLVCVLLLAAPALPLSAQKQAPVELQKGDRLPTPLKQVRPKYPFALRKKGISGVVKVRIIVSPEGRVAEAEVVESTHELFSEAALNAVNQWTFNPGLKDGVPVHVRMAFPIVFNLNEGTKKKPQP